MRDRDELLAAALGGTPHCPTIEQLEQLLDEDAPTTLSQHVKLCPHCGAELDLLRAFNKPPTNHEKVLVDAIAAKLRARSSQSLPLQSRLRRFFSNGWLVPGAVLASFALVFLSIQFRHMRLPAVNLPNGGSEVLRSAQVIILSPSGDVREKPSELVWQPLAGAATYEASIMEVDRTVLWRGSTNERSIALPETVETRIVESTVFLIRVSAFDQSGARIGESGLVRFRVAANSH